MRRVRLITAGIVAASVAALTVVGLSAQGSAPRTPWGHPDLQGTWDFRTVTPMERPPELANKATLTAEEAAEFERQQVEARNADKNRDTKTRATVNGTAETQDVALAYNDFWWDRGTKVVGTRRTSLVIDPPNGKIPELTREGRKMAEHGEMLRSRPAEGPEDRSIGERCIMGFNSGPPMAPAAYNMNVQVFQTPDYVVLLNEMVHNARIIPLDGRPQLTIPQWVGSSRGRWEGDTLVVETKNFYKNTSLRGSSPTMHLTERFKRVDVNTLQYEFTVDDPTTWTKPWTAQIPMVRLDGRIYEYACHEGNYGMTSLLSGARAVDDTHTDARKSSSR
jgi:hypothetical protein